MATVIKREHPLSSFARGYGDSRLRNRKRQQALDDAKARRSFEQQMFDQRKQALVERDATQRSGQEIDNYLLYEQKMSETQGIIDQYEAAGEAVPEGFRKSIGQWKSKWQEMSSDPAKAGFIDKVNRISSFSFFDKEGKRQLISSYGPGLGGAFGGGNRGGAQEKPSQFVLAARENLEGINKSYNELSDNASQQDVRGINENVGRTLRGFLAQYQDSIISGASPRDTGEIRQFLNSAMPKYTEGLTQEYWAAGDYSNLWERKSTEREKIEMEQGIILTKLNEIAGNPWVPFAAKQGLFGFAGQLGAQLVNTDKAGNPLQPNSFRFEFYKPPAGNSGNDAKLDTPLEKKPFSMKAALESAGLRGRASRDLNVSEAMLSRSPMHSYKSSYDRNR